MDAAAVEVAVGVGRVEVVAVGAGAVVDQQLVVPLRDAREDAVVLLLAEGLRDDALVVVRVEHDDAHERLLLEQLCHVDVDALLELRGREERVDQLVGLRERADLALEVGLEVQLEQIEVRDAVVDDAVLVLHFLLDVNLADRRVVEDLALLLQTQDRLALLALADLVFAQQLVQDELALLAALQVLALEDDEQLRVAD